VATQIERIKKERFRVEVRAVVDNQLQTDVGGNGQPAVANSDHIIDAYFGQNLTPAEVNAAYNAG